MAAYSYACADYPGMEKCPGRVRAQTEAELWQLIEAHARIAHGEDPASWGEDDRSAIRQLIRAED